MVGRTIAGLTPETMITAATRRTLRRELRLLEAVARRLAWLMADTVTLPPARPTAAESPPSGTPHDPRDIRRPAPSPSPTPAEPSAERRSAARPLIPLTEPPPALPPGWGSRNHTQNLAANRGASHLWPPHDEIDDRLVPAGALGARYAALELFAEDPEPMYRRMAIWFRRKQRERLRQSANPSDKRYRPRLRLLPAPARMRAISTGLPQLEDVLWFLHATVHNRARPPDPSMTGLQGA
ncbi:MAG: hypothetical protein AAGJ32_01575 [Pseudomonadota bacterium]